MIGHKARDGNKNRWADGTGRRKIEMEDGRVIAVVEAKIHSVGPAAARRRAILRNERKSFLFIFFLFILSCVICTRSFDSFLLIGSECL